MRSHKRPWLVVGWKRGTPDASQGLLLRGGSAAHETRTTLDDCGGVGFCVVSMNGSFNIRTRQGGSGRVGH
eukprot:6942358-Prymnesium_polylepis.1